MKELLGELILAIILALGIGVCFLLVSHPGI